MSLYQLSDPTYAEVHKKPQLLQYNEVPPPVPSYLADYDLSPSIPLFHGGDEPPVPPYNGPVTKQYSEVKREDVALHVLPHINTPAGDYSVLKRDVPLYNVTAGGDYSVLKREEREVSKT